MNFCPVCGKPTKNVFCDEHTLRQFDYKDVVVRVCSCKKYFYKNRWVHFSSLKKIVEKIAKDNIKAGVKLNALIDESIEKKDFEVEVFFNGELFVLPGRLIVEKCPVCSKKGTPYFESTLQLRPKDLELLDFVSKQVDKDKNAFISKVLELKNGYNVLLSSNKSAISIGKKMSKSFKGELKTSRHLFGYDKSRSKNLYRVTVFFRRE